MQINLYSYFLLFPTAIQHAALCEKMNYETNKKMNKHSVARMKIWYFPNFELNHSICKRIYITEEG